MAYPILVKPEAEQDIAQAFNWYNTQKLGLGYEFLECLDKVFTRLASSPEVHAVAYRNARLTLVRRFPYVVCYVFESNTVHVIAVFHGHRDPSVWKQRVQGK